MSAADHIVGLPLADTVSDNGSGKVRVTFPAWGLDWEVFDEAAVNGSHYLANAGRSLSAAITAKGGDEETGYWFDLGGVAYPSANWVTGDKCIPQIVAAVSLFTDPADGIAGAAAGDRLLFCLPEGKDAWWWVSAYIANYATGLCHAIGMLSRQRVKLGTSLAYLWNIRGGGGNNLSVAPQLIIRNFTLKSKASIVYCNDPDHNFKGVKRQRCREESGLSATYISDGQNDVFVHENIDWQGAIDFVCSAVTTIQHFVTATPWCKAAFGNGGNASTFKNCLVLHGNSVWDDYGKGTSIISNCASGILRKVGLGTDWPSGSGNLLAQTAAQLALWQDNDNGIFQESPRILNASTLKGAGVAIPGITRDIDGNLRADPPSIGCHEGTAAVDSAISTAEPMDDVAAIAAIDPGDTVGLLDNAGLKLDVTGTVDVVIKVEVKSPTLGTWSTATGGDVASYDDVPLVAGVLKLFTAMGAAPSWTSPDAEAVYRWHIYVTGDATDEFVIYFQAKYAESHVADEVLKSAGGGWDDDNLGAGDEGNVKDGVAFGLGQEGTYAPPTPEAPAPPSWGAAPVAGDGQVTINVIAANPTDVIYARHAPFSFNPSWSAESETFKRTGSGPIIVTGLTNDQLAMFTVYAKDGTLTSAWLAPRCKTPTANAAAGIEEIIDAVKDQLNALGLTSKTEAGDAVTIAATDEIPPRFDAVNTPCFKVFPDNEEAEPARGRNQITYRVNVAFCQRSKAAVQKAEQFRVREQLRDQFLGKRLVAMPTAICVGEAESAILDMETLQERFQWISVVTLEFEALKARG